MAISMSRAKRACARTRSQRACDRRVQIGKMTHAYACFAHASNVCVSRSIKPDRAVDQIDVVREEIAPHVVHEVREPSARHVQLRDHLRSRDARAELPVERIVIVIEIQAELMRRPIRLSRGLQIKIRELIEGAQLVAMCEPQQPTPVSRRQSH